MTTTKGPHNYTIDGAQNFDRSVKPRGRETLLQPKGRAPGPQLRHGGWCLAGILLLFLTAAPTYGQPPGDASAQQAQKDKANHDRAIGLAREAIASGNYARATDLLSTILEAWPGDPEATELLKQIQGRTVPAAPTPADIANRDRALAVARQAMAAGDYARATELLNLVLQAWPGDPTATELLRQARRTGPAPTSYGTAIAMAQSALSAGDYETAIARANDALAFRPGDPTAKDILQRASVRRGAEPPTKMPETPPPVVVAPPRGTAPVAAVPPGGKAALPAERKHRIEVSGDFLLGQGTVTLPIGYSLAQSIGGIATISGQPTSADRSSEYFGGTISYSYRQAWFVDLSYAQGDSSGSEDIPGGDLGNLQNAQFSIKDDWYQVYVRYTFPSLRGRRFSAYVRAGGTYVNAKLTVDAVSPAEGRYHQNDSTDDYLGNVGFGLSYLLYNKRLRARVQFEGEGFFGNRSQTSTEVLNQVFDQPPTAAKIDNTLYGGLARATVRLEYPLGRSGTFNLFGDLGVQGRYTLLSYPGAGSSHELLYGPYIRLGLRTSF